MAQQPWSAPFLSDLADCLASEGPVRVLDVVHSEISSPSMEYDSSKGDPLAYLAPLLCATSLHGHQPLLDSLVSMYLPRIIEHSGDNENGTSAYGLCSLVKSALLIADWLDRPTAIPVSALDHLVDSLVEDLEHYNGLPKLSDTTGVAGRAKKRKFSARPGTAQLGSGGRAVVQLVRSILGSDEELRKRWPVFRKLSTH